uniref:Odorant binding protein 3 n=1 Tax=Sirex noctilio TaxID=36765 RepID=A0A857N7G7_9HYME|nr:odorant binding protein 3 [Sirex noctilio]
MKKSFVIWAICFLTFASAVPVDEVEPSEETKNADIRKFCRESTGITLEEIEQLRKDPKKNVLESGKCYVKCMAERSGVEKDGEVQMDVAIVKRPEGVSQEDVEKLISECSGETKSDDLCERSFQRYICFFEKSEKKITIT